MRCLFILLSKAKAKTSWLTDIPQDSFGIEDTSISVHRETLPDLMELEKHTIDSLNQTVAEGIQPINEPAIESWADSMGPVGENPPGFEHQPLEVEPGAGNSTTTLQPAHFTFDFSMFPDQLTGQEEQMSQNLCTFLSILATHVADIADIPSIS